VQKSPQKSPQSDSGLRKPELTSVRRNARAEVQIFLIDVLRARFQLNQYVIKINFQKSIDIPNA
jgi:hypothetical protein